MLLSARMYRVHFTYRTCLFFVEQVSCSHGWGSADGSNAYAMQGKQDCYKKEKCCNAYAARQTRNAWLLLLLLLVLSTYLLDVSTIPERAAQGASAGHSQDLVGTWHLRFRPCNCSKSGQASCDRGGWYYWPFTIITPSHRKLIPEYFRNAVTVYHHGA